jgi:resolvase-like protein
MAAICRFPNAINAPFALIGTGLPGQTLLSPHTKTLPNTAARKARIRARQATYLLPLLRRHPRGFDYGEGSKRAALYVRVLTDHQSVENQICELRQIAERRGWLVAEVYRDSGISGAKEEDQRPGLDGLLKDASRRKFDVVMAWAIDRLGRSLVDLLGMIQHLEAVGVALYLDQQSIDIGPLGQLALYNSATVRTEHLHAGGPKGQRGPVDHIR